MNGETPNTENTAPKTTEWDSLVGYDAIEQNLQDEFLNIEDMLKSGRITEGQAEKFREEVVARADDEKKLQELLGRKEQGVEDDFVGERNINDQTGRERTFSEWDLYPRQKGETSAEYGERLRQMHELSADAEAEIKARAGAHARLEDEDQARHEAEARARLEEEERVKLEHAAHARREDETLSAQAQETSLRSEHISDRLRQIEAKQREIDAELIARGEGVVDRIDQQIAAIDAELMKRGEGVVDRIDQKLAEINSVLRDRGETLEPDLDLDTPLVAINADFTHDKKELARDQAEQDLNDELSAAGFIKRIWKGNLFRKYYQKKYEREYLEGERVIIKDGEENDVEDIIAERSGSAIERFTKGATDEYDAMVHKAAGERLTEADAHTTEVVKDAIEWFASAEIPEGGSLSDLRREFGNRIGRLKAEGRDQGQPTDELLINNYYEVAVQARQRAEHGVAMDRVMDGFRVYNAEVRDGMRTEVHRDNVDKIISKIEGSKIGSVVPAEAIAAAVGTAVSLTQTGARAALGIVGALGVGGVSQGLRARNRVTEDRARMMRDIASGHEYDGTLGEETEGHAAKQRAKYEARIGGTLYDIRSASGLIQDLNAATQSGDRNNIVRAIAEARVRIDYSDSEKRDLVGYSSGDVRGDERLALDLAVINAENSLSEHDKEEVAFMNGHIGHYIAGDIDAKDAAFRRLRAAEAVKAAGKSIAFGAVAFFGSQEITAALDPAKIGFFEKVGLLKMENADNTSETVVAGLAGPRTTHTEFSPDTHTEHQILEDIEGDRTVEIEKYKEMGWEQIEVEKGWTEVKQDVVSVEPAASDHQVRVAYDGWANNGTTISDSNELSANLVNGQFVSSMFGDSTMGEQAFDYDQLVANGRIRGYLTIGGAKFEIASTLNESGQLTWGENGVFTTTTGETIRAIGDNGEKLYQYFEVALDNGVDGDGVTHIMPFATDVGDNTFNGTIDQLAETTIEHPAVYDFAKDVEVTDDIPTEVANEITYGGVATPGVTSRVGVGTAYTMEEDQFNSDEQSNVDPAAVTAPLEPTPDAAA